MTESGEHQEWTGTPSQWENAGWFAACLLLVPIPYALWRAIVTRSTRYTLTTQRLTLQRGVFHRLTEDLELYRVRDTRLQQTFAQRLVGIGDVVLFTTDASTPELHLRHIADAPAVREKVRGLVEARRDAKRVRAFESDHDHDHDHDPL